MSTVPGIYRHVIEDVVRNVRGEFQNEGVDERVLQRLRELWEHKLNLFSQPPIDDFPNESLFAPSTSFASYAPLPPGSIAPTAVQQPFTTARGPPALPAAGVRGTGIPAMARPSIQQTDGLNDDDDDDDGGEAPPAKRYSAADESDRPRVFQLEPENDDDGAVFEAAPVMQRKHLDDSELGSDLDGSGASSSWWTRASPLYYIIHETAGLIDGAWSVWVSDCR